MDTVTWYYVLTALGVSIAGAGTVIAGFRALVERRAKQLANSPSGVESIVGASTDLAEALRLELRRMNSDLTDMRGELHRLEVLVDQLEKESAKVRLDREVLRQQIRKMGYEPEA